MHGSAAHERRQSDVYRSIRTLNELSMVLKNDGFNISRSGLYLRLLQKRGSSIDGKRHIKSVPVKLIRAQNDKHSKHIDCSFCRSTISCLEELSSLLGPSEVCFVSQDDKSRVPLGLAAANKQSPLLMHVEYRIQLPEHDWVVATQHKLIPSVYAGIEILSDGLGKAENVTYSGPTYIAIRSGKHSTSTAMSHALDFEKILNLEEFNTITRHGKDGLVKPVLVFTVDGGPDENPRYQKTITVAVYHFLKHNADAVFIATNAPGRRAFNRVERRMAPLSNDLSGLMIMIIMVPILMTSETVDKELEKQNFIFDGQTLAEIWCQSIIDNLLNL